MVSNAKRMRYVSENEMTSSDGEDYSPGNQDHKPSQKSKGKWLSKNAIMARENRLKKKLYISNLEREISKLKNDNGNFSKVVETQSLLITDLRKEIKYLKSVIANSTDISRLIKSIQQNTGMSVTTSLDENLSLNVSKPKLPIARKTAHPWEESHCPRFPTPESDFKSSPQSECGLGDFNDDLFSNIQLDEIMGDHFADSVYLDQDIDTQKTSHLKEHNYTTSADDEEEVGVCLHVSKHRVSLEFCSSCSENASQAWND